MKTIQACRYCPGDTPADGTHLDRNGELHGICVDCQILVWARDWAAIEQRVWDYQMSDANQLDRLRHGLRARRVARRWAKHTQALTVGRPRQPRTFANLLREAWQRSGRPPRRHHQAPRRV